MQSCASAVIDITLWFNSSSVSAVEILIKLKTDSKKRESFMMVNEGGEKGEGMFGLLPVICES